MRVALVPHIPYDRVLRDVENGVQGDGQLHHAEIGGEVAAVLRKGMQQLLADFPAEDLLLLPDSAA